LTLTLTGIDALSRDAAAVAQLLYEATPKFFDLLPGDRSERIDLIRKLVGGRGTDMEQVVVGKEADHVVGAFAGFPATEHKKRELGSLMMIARSISHEAWNRMKEAARSYASELTAVPSESWYLARIAVAPAARGRGVGAELLAAAAVSAGARPISLHVHRTNSGAIAFYRRAGFRELESTASFLLLGREPRPS
jgi:GNAT superfamily N-acetyltransferase